MSTPNVRDIDIGTVDPSEKITAKNDDTTMIKVLEKGTIFEECDSDDDAPAKVAYSIAVCEPNDGALIVNLLCHMTRVPEYLEKTEALEGIVVSKRRLS